MMAVFEIQAPDGSIYEVEAPDEQAAIQAIGQLSAPVPQQKSRSAALMDAAVAAPTEAEYRRLMAEANAAAVQDGETPDGVVYDPRSGGLTDVTLRPDQGALMAAAQGAGQGVSFGGMDEAVGALYGLMGPGSYPQNRDYALASMRADLDAGRQDHPVAAYGSELAGAMSIPVGAVGQGGSVLGRAALSGGMGAAQGAAYGFGSAEGGFDSRKDAAARGAVFGGLLGAAAPAVGAGARKAVEKVGAGPALRAAARGAPSIDDLRGQANALYAQADQVANLPRADFDAAMQLTLADAARKGLDPDLTPGAAKVADRLSDALASADPNIGFRELDILRRKAQVPAGNVANRTEQALGSRMIEGIDDYIEAADPALGGMVGEARDMWSRMRKAETLERIMDTGDAYLSGKSSGIRNQVRSLLKSPKASRGFTAAEKEALKRVSNPGPLENALHLASGGLGQMVTVGAGGGIGGIPGALAGAGIAAAARKGSEAITTRKAQLAQALIANGGQVTLPTLPPAQQALIEALYMAGVRPTAAALADALR